MTRPLRILLPVFIAIALIAAVFLAIRASIDAIPIVKYGAGTAVGSSPSMTSAETRTYAALSGRTTEYRNDVFGFSFSYPEEWEIEADPLEGSSTISDYYVRQCAAIDGCVSNQISTFVYLDTTIEALTGPYSGQFQFDPPESWGTLKAYKAVLASPTDVYLVQHGKHVLKLQSAAEDESGDKVAQALFRSFTVYDPPPLPDAGKDFTAKADVPFTFSTYGADVRVSGSRGDARPFVQERVDHLQECQNVEDVSAYGNALAAYVPKLQGKTMQIVTVQGAGEFAGVEVRMSILPNVFGYTTPDDADREWAACAVGFDHVAVVTPAYAVFTSGCGGVYSPCSSLQRLMLSTLTWK